MKRNIDKFLLGLLWAIALLLAASFWFDIRFGFNIFARAHWRYLANIQTTDAPVSTTFYVSLVIFTLLLPIGLYLISQPYRRIRARRTVHSITPDADLNYRDSHTPLAVLNAQPPTPITPPAAPAPVRPPELKVPPHLQHNIIPQNHNVAIATHDEPQTTEIHRDVSHIKKIISDAGYIIKKSPSIGGTRRHLGGWFG
ncbi:MAG: hypothetical protein FWF34_01445 [Alphaproteobacteria bacterium]|nr:hypothetical protein [Alphaproteobacteria bacterium]